MKSDRNYSPSDCFQTFPFPESAISEQHQKLEELGEAYHGHRKQLMLDQQEGLTTTYNRFHNPEEDNAAHIQLRELHQQMDEAVLRAYGWEDLIEQTYPLAEGKYNGTQLHDFYEVDYLPENDRVRYTLHPEARREVLKRLLLLNHKRYEEEIRQGLHKKKDAEAFYTQKGEEMPEAVKALYAKGAKKPKQKTLALPEEKDDSTPVSAERNKLFIDDETSSPQRKEVSLHSRVVVTNRFTNETRHYIIVADIKNSQTEIGYEPLTITSQLALAMLNRKVGSKFALDRAEYEVLEIK